MGMEEFFKGMNGERTIPLEEVTMPDDALHANSINEYGGSFAKRVHEARKSTGDLDEETKKLIQAHREHHNMKQPVRRYPTKAEAFAKIKAAAPARASASSAGGRR